MAGFPEHIPDLQNEQVWLREFGEQDVPAWFERLHDRGAADLAGDPAPESLEQCYTWLESHREAFRAQTGLRWAIVPRQTADEPRSVGSMGLTDIDLAAGTAEIGAAVGRASWNQGIASAAARLVLHYATTELGLTTIRADLLQRNHASRRVLEKCGFSRVAELADYRKSGDGHEPGWLYEFTGNG